MKYGKRKGITAICLLLAAGVCVGLLFGACGESVGSRNMYLHTYAYDGVYGSYESGIGTATSVKSYGEILSDELSKVDWQATLGDADFSESVTTVERAKALLNAKAEAVFDSAYRNCEISFGSVKQMTVQFGNKMYALSDEWGEEEPAAAGTYLTIYEQSDTEYSRDLGTFYFTNEYDRFRIVCDAYTDLSGNSDVAPSLYLDVVFAEPVAIPSGTTTAIHIPFFAAFAQKI